MAVTCKASSTIKSAAFSFEMIFSLKVIVTFPDAEMFLILAVSSLSLICLLSFFILTPSKPLMTVTLKEVLET